MPIAESTALGWCLDLGMRNPWDVASNGGKYELRKLTGDTGVTVEGHSLPKDRKIAITHATKLMLEARADVMEGDEDRAVDVFKYHQMLRALNESHPTINKRMREAFYYGYADFNSEMPGIKLSRREFEETTGFRIFIKSKDEYELVKTSNFDKIDENVDPSEYVTIAFPTNYNVDGKYPRNSQQRMLLLSQPGLNYEGKEVVEKFLKEQKSESPEPSMDSETSTPETAEETLPSSPEEPTPETTNDSSTPETTEEMIPSSSEEPTPDSTTEISTTPEVTPTSEESEPVPTTEEPAPTTEESASTTSPTATIETSEETTPVITTTEQRTTRPRSNKICVGDYVWFDENRNGLQDEGEKPVPNVKVTVTDSNGEEHIAITDENGKWTVCDIETGKTKITFDVPGGYEVTKSVPDAPGRNSVGSVSERNVTDNDFDIDLGIIPVPGTPEGICVGDYVWVDRNKDGLQDAGETPVEGVKVTVTDSNGEEHVTVTDENGKWIVCDIETGETKVKFDVPSGFEVTKNVPDAVGKNSVGSSSVHIIEKDNFDIDMGVIKKEEGLARTGVDNMGIWLGGLFAVLFGAVLLRRKK